MTKTSKPLLRSEIPGLQLLVRGKVRDVYDLGERLLIVATDRLSAFDCVLPTPIPGKGALLTQLSSFWFRKTARIVPNHLLSSDLDEIQRELPRGVKLDAELYAGRVTLARKARRVDAECVVRGFLAGSAYKEYRASGSVCAEPLPAGLVESARLSSPLFTPSTKASVGHDENISRAHLAEAVGRETALELERLSLALFRTAAAHAEARGLLLADTKFEFGFIDKRLHLIDEALTPDSSRFWEKGAWKPGVSPESFDKQFVRDWLERCGWDKRPPAPPLPPEVVEGTASRYREAHRRLTE
ncbi:MAG: phosphoribosylaminoimidazolesuccinocarboxamide synthase [Elusimicrobiota bacterium]|jgi:phosphoribosylaminoimidazole-succinocarboxamide synthase